MIESLPHQSPQQNTQGGRSSTIMCQELNTNIELASWRIRREHGADATTVACLVQVTECLFGHHAQLHRVNLEPLLSAQRECIDAWLDVRGLDVGRCGRCSAGAQRGCCGGQVVGRYGCRTGTGRAAGKSRRCETFEARLVPWVWSGLKNAQRAGNRVGVLEYQRLLMFADMRTPIFPGCFPRDFSGGQSAGDYAGRFFITATRFGFFIPLNRPQPRGSDFSPTTQPRCPCHAVLQGRPARSDPPPPSRAAVAAHGAR